VRFEGKSIASRSVGVSVLHVRVLFSFSKEVGLRLLLLLKQEVEMIVESRRPDLCAGGQLLQSLVAATRTVDIDACYENATQALDTRNPHLCPHHISDERHMSSRELP
jgi:hypothetical protein